MDIYNELSKAMYEGTYYSEGDSIKYNCGKFEFDNSVAPILRNTINKYKDIDLKPKEIYCQEDDKAFEVKYLSQGSTNCSAMHEMLKNVMDELLKSNEFKIELINSGKKVYLNVGSRYDGYLGCIEYEIK